jgi:uncharacterized membrane protein YidH (DUF202 family)
MRAADASGMGSQIRSLEDFLRSGMALFLAFLPVLLLGIGASHWEREIQAGLHQSPWKSGAISLILSLTVLALQIQVLRSPTFQSNFTPMRRWV